MKFLISASFFLATNAVAGIKFYHQSDRTNIELVLEQLEYYFGATRELVEIIPTKIACSQLQGSRHELVICLDKTGRIYEVQKDLPKLNDKYRIFRELDQLSE